MDLGIANRNSFFHSSLMPWWAECKLVGAMSNGWHFVRPKTGIHDIGREPKNVEGMWLCIHVPRFNRVIGVRLNRVRSRDCFPMLNPPRVWTGYSYAVWSDNAIHLNNSIVHTVFVHPNRCQSIFVYLVTSFSEYGACFFKTETIYSLSAVSSEGTVYKKLVNHNWKFSPWLHTTNPQSSPSALAPATINKTSTCIRTC